MLNVFWKPPYSKEGEDMPSDDQFSWGGVPFNYQITIIGEVPPKLISHTVSRKAQGRLQRRPMCPMSVQRKKKKLIIAGFCKPLGIDDRPGPHK